MQTQNRRHGHQFKVAIGALGAAIMGLTVLIYANTAEAGIAAGPSIQASGRFELEFDTSTQQFTLIEIDSSGTETEIAYQEFFDKKEERNRLAGLLGLRAVMGTPPDPAGLVSFGEPPDYDNASIDVGKLALGACGRNCTGTGAGQIDISETWRIDFLGFVVANPVWQVEVKQDVAAKVTYLLNDVLVGEHYLLSGRSATNEPAEVPEDASKCEVQSNISDGGPDSGNGDDGFCTDEDAPLHNAEVWEVINAGLLSIKGGGEFPFPDLNRTTWDYFDSLLFLNCGEEAASAGGEVTVLRAIENVGGGCDALIGYVLAFDPATNTVEWDVADPNNQNLGTIFDPVEFLPEPKVDTDLMMLSEDKPTILSYTDNVDCTGLAMFPYHPPGVATRTCIGLQTCEGQPVRVCRSFGDGDTDNDSNLSCTTDEDCLLEGETCALINLDPVTLTDGVFPDLVPNTAVCEFSGVSCTPPGTGVCETDEMCIEQREYGCVFDDRVLFLGATGSCSVTAEQTCSVDTDCPDSQTCVIELEDVEEIQKTQGIFLFDDARISRGR